MQSRNTTSSTLLQGRWLVVARTVWALMALVAVGSSLAGLATAYSRTNVAASLAVLSDSWAPYSIRAPLAEVGLSLLLFSEQQTVLHILVMLAFWGVAFFLFWRRSNDWMVLLVSIFLMTWGRGVAAPWPMLDRFLSFAGWTLFFTVFFVFPDGRFVPRWSRGLLAVWIGVLLSWNFLPESSPFYAPNWPPWLFWPLVLAMWLGVPTAQLYRYVRVSDPVQRQQTKWVVFGVVGLVIGLSVSLLPLWLLTSLREVSKAGGWYGLVLGAIFTLSTLSIPFSLAVAALRYRLWDADWLIERTLVYGVVTTALGIIYALSIVALEYLFRMLVGGESGNELAVVLPTLAMAALFMPVRQWAQNFIDRRFYRSKYDATQALAAFSEMIYDEVNLDRISSQLVQVVNETMQPVQVSLWLRPRETTNDKRD